MTGTNQVDDSARAKCTRTLSQIKRVYSVTNIKKIFELSKMVFESPSELPKFRSLEQDIFSLRSQFNIRNYSLLNICIDLDVATKFDEDCELIVREWVASIRLVVDQTRDKSVMALNIDALSVAGASDHIMSSDRRSEDHCQSDVAPRNNHLNSNGIYAESR